MKKFGTPTAAGPGVATEVVGFVVAGLPLERLSGQVEVEAGAVAVVGVVVPASGWTALHSPPELEAWVMHPVEPVRLPWRCRGREVRLAGVAVAVALALGAAVGSTAGVAVAVPSGVCVAVGELTIVSTGDGKGDGVLSDGAAVGVPAGSDAGVSVAVGAVS